MPDICTMQLTPAAIKVKRAEVTQRIFSLSPNITGSALNRISASDLELLFLLYDEIFFAKQLKTGFNGKMLFSLSSRMTRSAGKTFFSKYSGQLRPDQITVEIRMSVDFFFQFNDIAGPKTVCGLAATNALEAFLLVFEHEICHFIEFSHFQTSNCKGQRFKTLARHIFGHTESYHKLPTQKQIAYHKYGFKIGDLVTFSFEDRQFQGIINRIHKRATVMVKDPKGVYADAKGTRYTKYYVPIELLNPAK